MAVQLSYGKHQDLQTHCECAWKSEDEGIECDTSKITKDKLEAELNALAEEKGTYVPHCDADGNYGDESVHAVYDELNKLKYDWHC